jgi:FAD/FMN-containing dehydrogenase/Fe-S oxidoreductase
MADGHRSAATGKLPLVLPVLGKPRPAGEVDQRRLEAELGAVIEGDVRFDRGHRAMFSTDASHYRHVPIGVVMPRTKDDVVRTVEVCRRHRVPVVGRGAGTSLAGNGSNVGVVLDYTRYMTRVLEVDPERRLARVEPGCVLDDLRALTHPLGLTFGPDPATHSRCTFGGMIGNNACGIHSVLAQWHTGPRTSDNLHRLEVVTYDGARFWTGPTSDEEMERILAEGGRRAEIYRALRALASEYARDVREGFPDIPRRVSGYNLDDLLPEKDFHVARALSGSEGTCVLYLEAEVHLIPWPRGRALVVAGFRDIYEAADAVPRVMARRPIGLEGLDERIVRYNRQKRMNEDAVRLLPQSGGYLLVEVGGHDRADALARARALAASLQDDAEGSARTLKLFDDPADEAKVWEVRESGLGATALVKEMGHTWEGWEDTAVPPARLGDYLRDLRVLMDAHGYDGAFYGHFGQGLLHVRINFDLETRDGIARYLRFLRAATELVVRYGGSISGEHGDGQARGALLAKMFTPRLMQAFRRFREIWDPAGRMNPGRIVDAYLPSQNLILGADWAPRSQETYFAFPDDEGGFQSATIRCVGVGKCRKRTAGTMCPSYMVTREEEHSTRGRARALFEMVRGEVITEGWRSDEVHRALELCLSCKACKSECPVNVDMATYKAEFYAHYWAGRLRPRQAYAFGWIMWWARAVSLAPTLVNWLGRTEPFAGLAKAAAGVHSARRLPAFAGRTFRRELQHLRGTGAARARPAGAPARLDARDRTAGGRGRVVFWPDTFTNHFHTDAGIAAVRVLEALGYEVVLPPPGLCCGRPLYDFGFLGIARRFLSRAMDALEPYISAGVPVVGVEPSCVSTFRDELRNLFPRDQRAKRLSMQTFMLGEFLDAHAADADLGRVDASALLHGHCHHKSVLDFASSQRVLARVGVRAKTLDSGCCGMAGPFGFDKDHYGVAQACAERVLLPAVRSRDAGSWLVTDGFSCRTMVEQNVEDVRTLSLGEVVWKGLEGRAP